MHRPLDGPDDLPTGSVTRPMGPVALPGTPAGLSIDWRAKGFPALDAALDPRDLPDIGWDLFDGRALLPVMVLHLDALEHNIALIADYCAQRGVSLAPHGKTTMAPAIFERQLAAGAWGMTLATAWQARVAVSVGVQRILIANQVTDPGSIDWVAATLHERGPDIHCWVDSVAGVELLDAGLQGHHRRLPVLVEVGLPGGRTGARTLDAAIEVARRVRDSTGLRLAGVSFFEGIAAGDTPAEQDAAVRRLIDLARELVLVIDDFVAADGGTEILLSGGGSRYPDLVVDGMTEPLDCSLPVRGVLRSGGTVTHDHGGYDLVSPFGSERADGGPRLRAALEVWAPVLSMPEPGLAIAGAGKRDLPYDGPPPIVVSVRDRSGAVRWMRDDTGLRTTQLNDQHAYLSVDPGVSLAVGDLVAFGVRHACMAFDRWRWIPVVDSDYRIVDAFETIF